MNERIKALLVRAIKEIGPDDADKGAKEKTLEKFAELIIKRCIEACSRANEIRHFVPPTQQQVVLSCMGEIERTFGVE